MKTLVLLGAAAALCLSLSCGDDSGGADASITDAAPNTGTFTLAWTLSDGTDVVTCGDVGAITVSVRVQPAGGVFGAVDPFACTTGAATSRGLAPGTYRVEIDLKASGSRSLLESPVVQEVVVITEGSTTDLGQVDFVVAPEGVLVFSVDAQATGSNCDGGGGDDAGIVATRLELRDGSGACVASSFDVSEGGAGASGTYATDCPSVATFGCIDKEQTVTLDPAPSGPHSLVVVATKNTDQGNLECYRRTSQFTVPGAGLQYDLGTVLLNLDETFGCDPSIVAPDAGIADAGLPDAL